MREEVPFEVVCTRFDPSNPLPLTMECDMNLRLFSMVLAVGIALLGFSVTAHADAAADFALFDNTNPATLNEGIVCTSDKAFTYHISVSNFGSGPNVLRLTYADGDFTRFKIAQDGSLNLSGGARGGNKGEGGETRASGRS